LVLATLIGTTLSRGAALACCLAEQDPPTQPYPQTQSRLAPPVADDRSALERSEWFGQDPVSDDQDTPEDLPELAEPPKTLFEWSTGAPIAGAEDEEDGIEPLATDRPDFTESSSTVGRGVLQLEMGYTYSSDGDGASHEHSYPEFLMRYGVCAEWLEVRLGQNFASQSSGGGDVSGAEDLYLGAKVALTPQEGIWPEMAILPQLTVPTGASALTAGEVLPGVNWLYGWDVTERLTAAGSTQFNRAIDEVSDGAYTEWAQSVTFGYSLTDCLSAYGEWFVLVPHSAETAGTEHYVNGGFTRRLSPDVQWDVRAGIGLGDAADEYFVGAGLSVRFR